MNIISEYIFKNPKLDEINKIISKTHDEHVNTDPISKLENICEVEFIDKLRNKIKVVKIKRYNIRY